MFKKVLIILALGIALLIAIYHQDISNIVNTATGHSVKNICSGHYNSGMSIERVLDEALLPVDFAFHFVSVEHDTENKIFKTSIFGLFQRSAIHRQGLGCTLLGVGQNDLSGSIVPVTYTVSEDIPWPNGHGDIIVTKLSQQLQPVLDNAFSEPSSEWKRHTKAIVIVHDGQLITERYAEGVASTTPLLSWSMAKSVTNLLYATAVKNELLSISDPASIKYWQTNDDPRKAITIDHLLRMSSGLAFDETYAMGTDVPHMLANEISAGDYAAQKPLQYPIDTHWSYSSGTANILAKKLFDTVGDSLQSRYDYVQKNLFQPLAMDSAILEVDGSNHFVGSSYFYATARDWAKLGQLMLQDGIWNNQRLLPEGWVKYSTTPTPTAPLNQYGAHFWLNAQPKDSQRQRTWPLLPEDTYFMSGYQGQYVMVVPSQKLVVVRLGFTYPQGGQDGIQQLVADTIKLLKHK